MDVSCDRVKSELLSADRIKCFVLGEPSLTPFNFCDFCRHLLMFKNSYLGVLKFGFLSLYPFRT
jgi:hypothetical protein